MVGLNDKSPYKLYYLNYCWRIYRTWLAKMLNEYLSISSYASSAFCKYFIFIQVSISNCYILINYFYKLIKWYQCIKIIDRKCNNYRIFNDPQNLFCTMTILISICRVVEWNFTPIRIAILLDFSWNLIFF